MNPVSFPWSAIVGQSRVKAAYLINIVNPEIGGLLLSGPKGTGKSSIVKAIESVTLHVDEKLRVLTLPLSITEDRLLGTIDIERMLASGERRVTPGLLEAAHKNILYIDEVNLLPDHIIDDILDVSASHVNTIERDGISHTHPADFVLVGSMNPEEGDLRPQILDRFPLSVLVESIMDPTERKEIVKRNIAFQAQREKFVQSFVEHDRTIAQAIVAAKEILPEVTLSEMLLEVITKSCADLLLDGQRPDITITKAALALAALDGRQQVSYCDIELAAEFTLVHRTRKGGLLGPASIEIVQEIFRKNHEENQRTLKSNNSAIFADFKISSSLGSVDSKKKT